MPPYAAIGVDKMRDSSQRDGADATAARRCFRCFRDTKMRYARYDIYAMLLMMRCRYDYAPLRDVFMRRARR